MSKRGMKLIMNEDGRFQVGEDGRGIHCGETLFLRAKEEKKVFNWIDVQVEMNRHQEWYGIIRHEGWAFTIKLKEGMEAREPGTGLSSTISMRPLLAERNKMNDFSEQELISLESGVRLLIENAENNLRFTEAKTWRALLIKILYLREKCGKYSTS